MRHHHQWARGGDFARGRPVLQLQRCDGLSCLGQVGGLAADEAQGTAHLRHHLLLRQHRGGALLSALHQGRDLAEFALVSIPQCRKPRRALAQAIEVGDKGVGAFLDLRERAGAAEQGLRHRLGQAL